MKIVKLFAFEQVYPKLKELPLNIKTSYTLSKIHQLALLDIEFYKNSLSNIINKYGQRDEEGNLKVAEDNFIPIIEGELERCQKEIGELKRVINSLLQNMDTMPKHCILIAATNHPELLDRAVWRRFLQKVEVGMPKEEALEDLIRLFCGEGQEKAVNQILNIKGLMTIFEGMSPSDLKNLFDRAKVKGFLAGQKDISISHLLFSVFELQESEKTEDEYIIYLKSKGLTQRVINELTGISLRKIKSLTSNK